MRVPITLAAVAALAGFADAQKSVGCCTANAQNVLTSCSGCSNTLPSLSLASNGLMGIAPGVFTNLTQLQSVTFDNNQLTTLPAGLFDKNVRLLSVSFANNKLSSLPGGLFSNNPALTGVSFARNALKSLPSSFLASKVNLTGVDLSYNLLTSLPDDCFNGMGNSVTITTTSTTGVMLDLSSNQFSSVPANGLTNMPQLQWLNFYNNPITSLPNQFLNPAFLPNLAYLNLLNINLAAVSTNAFTGFPALQRLGVSSQSLRSIAMGAFTGLNNLQILYLNGSQLTSLPAGVFAPLPSLTTLDLSDNLLASVSELFSWPTTLLPSLTTLSLQFNLITSLPMSGFTGCPRLSSLDLSYNSVSTLATGTFVGLPSLSSLNLLGNQLTVTPLPLGAFHGLFATGSAVRVGFCTKSVSVSSATSCGITYWAPTPTSLPTPQILNMTLSAEGVTSPSPAVGGVIGGLIVLGVALLAAVLLIVRAKRAGGGSWRANGSTPATVVSVNNPMPTSASAWAEPPVAPTLVMPGAVKVDV